MAKRKPVPGIREYDHSAGGWDALRAVAVALRRQEVVVKGAETLLRNNQPEDSTADQARRGIDFDRPSAVIQ